jgi:cytochrome c oxidase cbb3-type subunit III
MNSTWSWYVSAIVVINVVGCIVLLWRTSRSRSDQTEQPTTGHVWDENITEYDKPLPRWWINLFYITIVFSIGYLIWFPGMGNFAGTSKWTSRSEHDADKTAADVRMAPVFRAYEGKPLETLAADPRALALGRSVFANNCATCHGSAAQGAVGYPNLTDTNWQWGGTAATILQTVLQGRAAQMPSWAATLTSMGGDYATEDVVTYALSLTDTSLLATNAEAVARGKKLFGNVCAACHGADAHGNALLGAPNLTDDYWLYGRSRAAVREAITLGRNGNMPAHLPLIGETRARLAAAYVWSLSQPAAANRP